MCVMMKKEKCTKSKIKVKGKKNKVVGKSSNVSSGNKKSKNLKKVKTKEKIRKVKTKAKIRKVKTRTKEKFRNEIENKKHKITKKPNMKNRKTKSNDGFSNTVKGIFRSIWDDDEHKEVKGKKNLKKVKTKEKIRKVKTRTKEKFRNEIENKKHKITKKPNMKNRKTKSNDGFSNTVKGIFRSIWDDDEHKEVKGVKENKTNIADRKEDNDSFNLENSGKKTIEVSKESEKKRVDLSGRIVGFRIVKNYPYKRKFILIKGEGSPITRLIDRLFK